MSHAPRVIVIEPDQWPRAVLRAALIEAGYDAIGARRISASLRIPTAEPDRGPVRAVLIDGDALTEASPEDRVKMRERFAGAAFVLLARPTRAAPQGPWAAVLERPASIAQLVDAVRGLAPLA